MQRVFTSTLPAALRHILVRATGEEAAQFMIAAKNALTPYYSAGVADSCAPLLRHKIDLLVSGHHDQLLAIAKLDMDKGGIPLRIKDGTVVLDLPEAPLGIDPEPRPKALDYIPPVHHQLTAFETSSRGFRIRGVVGFSDVIDQVGDIECVLVNRDTKEECRVPTLIRRRFVEGITAKVEFEAYTSVVEHLPRGASHKGAWGIFIEMATNGLVRRARFGRMPASLAEVKYALCPASPGGAQPPVIAYFNQGFRNLTFDIGSFVHKSFSMPRMVGFDVIEETGKDQPTLMLVVESEMSPRPVFTSSGEMSLPMRKVGDSLYTVAYPIFADRTTRVGVSVCIDDIICSLPVPLPTWLESGLFAFQLNDEKELLISPRSTMAARP